MANRRGKSGSSERVYFWGLQNHCGHWLQPWNERTLLGRKAITNLDSLLKSRDITLPTKVHIVKTMHMVFPVVIYRCESWTIRKAECWRIDSFELWCWERLLRVPWTARSNQSILREINPEHIGRTDAEGEAPLLWPPDVKSQLIGKDPDAGKDWRQEEKGMTEAWDGWMASPVGIINGHEFEQAQEDTEGLGSLACCTWWGHQKSDMTELLNKKSLS